MRANWKYLVQERISVFRGQNFTAIFTLPDTHMLSMVIDFFHAIFWLCMTTTARKESTFCHRLHYIHSLESCIIDDYIWFSWSDYEYQIFKGMVFYYEICSDLLLEKFIVITITLYISLKGLVIKDFSILFFF